MKQPLRHHPPMQPARAPEQGVETVFEREAGCIDDFPLQRDERTAVQQQRVSHQEIVAERCMERIGAVAAQ